MTRSEYDDIRIREANSAYIAQHQPALIPIYGSTEPQLRVCLSRSLSSPLSVHVSCPKSLSSSISCTLIIRPKNRLGNYSHLRSTTASALPLGSRWRGSKY